MLKHLFPSAALLFALAGPAAADDRVETEAGPLRLLAGFAHGDTVDAGLAIDLKSGWKTYWRTPGDSGVPPRIALENAENVAALEVDFPAPRRFGEAASPSIGYTGRVTLPLRVRLVDPARPALLSVRVFLGLCRDICVPVEETLALPLGRSAPTPQAVTDLVRARAAVPRPAVAGADLSVASVTWQPGAEALVVVINGVPADLFAEGPQDWALALPERFAVADGHSRWRLSLAGLPAGAVLSGTVLRLTAVADGAAAESAVNIPPR